MVGQFFSSDLSPQSSSKSHTQRFCIHFPFPQVNSSDLHVSSAKITSYKYLFIFMQFYYVLHDFSSLPSEQSALSSHIHVNGTHSPGADLHVNSSAPHTLRPISFNVSLHIYPLRHFTYYTFYHPHRYHLYSLFHYHIASMTVYIYHFYNETHFYRK